MENINENFEVAQLSELMALRCSYSQKVARNIYLAALLHDIGKQAIPAKVLEKCGQLTHSEYTIMKTHTILGAEMLNCIDGELGVMARGICLFHHEWHNGCGYWGIYSYKLPVYISIVTICDAFVALINERPYKKAWPVQEALRYIQDQAGARFCPSLASIFCSMIRRGI